VHIDVEQLRRHYASLSDDALAQIHRGDLVADAQTILDAEVEQRKRASAADSESETSDTYEGPDVDGKPAWFPDAAQIFTEVENPNGGSAQHAAEIRSALESAGIPCFIETCDVEVPASDAVRLHEWRVFVPGNLNQRAMSTMERDIDNPSIEETWRVHLENLSDSELLEMNPKSSYCGLYDRIERIERVYDTELARRRLK